MHDQPAKQLKRLDITKGKCSYNQERIWIDVQIRANLVKSNEGLVDYNKVLVYQIDDGVLTIKRFREALKNVLEKHEIFRTSVQFGGENNNLQQVINAISTHPLYSYELTCLDVNDFEKVNSIIYKEQTCQELEFEKGRIFRCHLLKLRKDDKNHLLKNDYIIFVFHHSAIDEYSEYIFMKELTLAYQKGSLKKDDNQLRFIDFAQYERRLKLDDFDEFWQELFADYCFNHQIKLPYDNESEIKSSGSCYAFEIDKSLTRQIFRYKTKMNIHLFRLFLATYYAYLFKLTQDTDICITGVTPNRPHSDLNNIIGPFENIIVYRHHVDPQKTFNEFVRTIDKLCSNIKENSQYPYQELVAYARKFSTIKYPFTQVSLRLHIVDDQWSFDPDDNVMLKPIALTDHRLFERNTKLTPIDLTLHVVCNLTEQTIRFYFEYSNKRFETSTIELFVERYKKMLKQLFDVSSTYELDEEPLYKLSIILPFEETLMQNLKPDFE